MSGPEPVYNVNSSVDNAGMHALVFPGSAKFHFRFSAGPEIFSKEK
jgi:hypothetical protein